MKVFACAPVALEARAKPFYDRWKARGYEVAIQQDYGTPRWTDALTVIVPWQGVWKSWNLLAHEAVRAGADICVLLGDDMDPDPRHTAEEIGLQYAEHFPDLCGVLQQCGDPQGDLIDGKRNAERICGSPMVGKGWIRRAYEGRGPVFDGYRSFYADESLMHVATKLGRLWWRKDLVVLHRHWSWGHTPRQPYHEIAQRSWDQDKALFDTRKAQGFPGSGLLEEA